MERRDFLKGASGVRTALGVAGAAFGARPGTRTTGRVIGANDKINVGVIGTGASFQKP